jgi:hypothetical protein
MKTLVICRPAAGVTADEIAAHGSVELGALRELHERGVLEQAYSPGGPGAILIFATDGDAVTIALQSLPLVRGGLVATERIPLRPFDLA